MTTMHMAMRCGKCFCLGVLLFCSWAMAAQQAEVIPVSPSAKESANVDLSGYWVAFVTEDWRHRMLTPPKGDVAAIPLNAEGIRVANTWDWQRDQVEDAQCKAYGAPAIMRVPTRLRISWQDEKTLKLETDAGMQQRLFHFEGASSMRPVVEPTLQGRSQAEWASTRRAASTHRILNVPPLAPSYTLKVVTTELTAGYLRTNGVPYSNRTVMTEYFDTFTHVNGQEWLLVTSIVEDPVYLNDPYITTIHFKRETDGGRWRPTPCEIVAPTREERALPPDGYLPSATMKSDIEFMRSAQ